MDRTTTPTLAGLNPESVRSAISKVVDFLIAQEMAELLGDAARPQPKSTDEYLAAIQVLERWLDSIEGGGE